MLARLKKGSIELVEKTKNRFDPVNFFINTKFKQIFISYILIIFIFAGIYFALNFTENNGLMYNKTAITSNVNGFYNALYFSVITATATGYGDIAPIGLSKAVAILEVIAGLLIFGMLISKLVSYKQDILLDELYDLTFEDKINRLRSSLYLFRTDAGKVIERIESGQLTVKRLYDATSLITSFENTLEDIENILCPKKKKEFIKDLNELTLELVVNSMTLSLSRLTELVVILKNKYGNEWSNDKNILTISKIKTYCLKIQDYYKDQKLNESTLAKIRDINKNIYEIETAVSSKDNLPKDKQAKLVG